MHRRRPNLTWSRFYRERIGRLFGNGDGSITIPPNPTVGWSSPNFWIQSCVEHPWSIPPTVQTHTSPGKTGQQKGLQTTCFLDDEARGSARLMRTDRLSAA